MCLDVFASESAVRRLLLAVRTLKTGISSGLRFQSPGFKYGFSLEFVRLVDDTGYYKSAEYGPRPWPPFFFLLNVILRLALIMASLPESSSGGSER